MYYLLLENGKYVDYEEHKNGYEIIETIEPTYSGFDTLIEAQLEARNINSGYDEFNRKYLSNYNKVINVVRFYEV